MSTAFATQGNENILAILNEINAPDIFLATNITTPYLQPFEGQMLTQEIAIAIQKNVFSCKLLSQ